MKSKVSIAITMYRVSNYFYKKKIRDCCQNYLSSNANIFRLYNTLFSNNGG